MILSPHVMRFVMGVLTLVGSLACVLTMMLADVDKALIAAVASPVTLLLNHSGQIIRHLFPGGAEKEKA